MHTNHRSRRDALKPFAAGGSNGFTHSRSSPRSVTRGETIQPDENTPSQAAFVDWLAFTVWLPHGQPLQWLVDALETTFRVPCRDWQETGRGWNGYTHRVNLGEFGLLAHGGEMQKGSIHVELNARACRLIEDWNAVRLWGSTYESHITRVDLAHDDLEGEYLNIQTALGWVRSGKFNHGGRPPAAKFIDDMGSNKGCTLYVGQRASGKLLRVYEKGKELGKQESKWVRAEVELRNKGRSIPWDVVTSPGQYLAGAYAPLKFLCAEQQRLRTVQRIAEISYISMVNNLRTQGGKALNVMNTVNRGDGNAVLSLLMREGVPKRLAGFRDVIGLNA